MYLLFETVISVTDGRTDGHTKSKGVRAHQQTPLNDTYGTFFNFRKLLIRQNPLRRRWSYYEIFNTNVNICYSGIFIIFITLNRLLFIT